jgi:hypothetical protein
MTKLEHAISGTLANWKNLEPSTYKSRVLYFQKLIDMAKKLNIYIPCQKLFNYTRMYLATHYYH